MAIRLRVLASAAALMVVVAADARPASPQSTGTIAGTVALEPPPSPRRSARRYPGGQAEAHAVQQLPAVVYLVGPVADGGSGGATAPAMTQRDTTFVPSVVHVRVGGGVAFPNHDSFFHNVFSYSSAQRFDLGRYPQGESKDVVFDEPGIVEVFCEVHEFMRGAIVVTENRFFTVVDGNGAFRLQGVPAGEHTLAFWQQDHELLRQRVVVTPGATAQVEVELER